MKCFVFLAALATLAGSLESTKMPSFIKPCSLSSAELNACLMNVTKEVHHTFAKGIPELGVPSLDPVKLNKIAVNATGLRLIFDNSTVAGLGGGEINDFKMNLLKKKARLDYIGNITMKGQYKVDGRILILPITGEGDFTVILKNMNLVFYYNFNNYTGDDGKQYINMTITKRTFKIKSTHFDLQNLFNGNKLIAEPTLHFLNENWEIIMNEIGAPVVDQIIKACLKVVNKFHSKVPWEDLFLP